MCGSVSNGSISVGAVIATLHDVVLTVGLFAVMQLEFNLSSIAAILTIIGYSLNDTVVIYDRIRENCVEYKKHAPASPCWTWRSTRHWRARR